MSAQEEILKINRLLRKLNKLKRNFKKSDLDNLPQDGTLEYLHDSLVLLSDDFSSFCFQLEK